MRLRLIDARTTRFATYAELDKDEKDAKKQGEKLKYGILSHRWLADEDEVKFQDLQSLEKAKRKKGFFKIAESCRLAREDGINYVWLDTCCIDKSSSAELQESINSMFRWYREAAICYAYLKDATDLGTLEDDEWFERGWTLQELIAPKHVKFFDSKWRHIGDKKSLKDKIHAATGIGIGLLEDTATLQEYSIAERMSWASRRTTTVVEDRAYSLFGLFNVNMPMLYGEGEKAFTRLQEEIIRTSDDHSIFAWSGINEMHSGLLATKPDDFKNCGSVKSTRVRRGRSAYTMTNRGVSVTFNLTQWTLDTYLARIHCTDEAHSGVLEGTKLSGMTGIFLRRLDEDDQYARVKVDGEEFVHNARLPPNWQTLQHRNVFKEMPIYVRQAELTQVDHTVPRVFGFRISEDLLERGSNGKPLFSVLGNSIQWDEAERTVKIKPGTITFGDAGILDIAKQGKKICQIKLGFDFGFNPVVFLADSTAVDRKDRAFNKNGQLNISSDWQFTEDELHGAKGLTERSPNDARGWNGVGYNHNRAIASENGIRPGLWALKGDRIDGLDIYLGATEIHVVMKKVKTKAGHLVWDLRVDGLAAKRLRRLFA